MVVRCKTSIGLTDVNWCVLYVCKRALYVFVSTLGIYDIVLKADYRADGLCHVKGNKLLINVHAYKMFYLNWTGQKINGYTFKRSNSSILSFAFLHYSQYASLLDETTLLKQMFS